MEIDGEENGGHEELSQDTVTPLLAEVNKIEKDPVKLEQLRKLATTSTGVELHRNSHLWCSAGEYCTGRTEVNRPSFLKLPKSEKDGVHITVVHHFEYKDGYNSDGESRLCACGRYWHSARCKARHVDAPGVCRRNAMKSRRGFMDDTMLKAASRVNHYIR